MNSLCPSLLRDAGRLDILELESERQVRSRKLQVPVRVVRRSLDKVALRLRVASVSQLAEDWRALGCAKRDATTLTSLLRALALAASSEGRGPCWIPRFGEGRDLRPWLSDREVLRGWLVEMSHLWAQAVAPLVKQQVLPKSASLHAPSSDGSFCPDVFILSRFGSRIDMREGEFDSRFARRLLPFVSGDISLAEVRRMEALFLSMPVLLQEDTGLCRLASHGAAGARWMALLPTAHDRLTDAQLLLDLILKMDAWKRTPAEGTHRLFATVMHMSGSPGIVIRMRWAIDCLLKGAPPGWVAGTMRLAARTNYALPVIERFGQQQPSAQRIASFARKWGVADYRCWQLWQAASLYPGVWEMLRELSPKSWCHSVASRLWRWVASFGAEDAKSMPGRWALLRKHWKEILELARSGNKESRWEIINVLQYGFKAERAERVPELGADTLLWAHALRNAQTIDASLRGDLLFRMLPCFASNQRKQIANHLTRLLSATKKVARSYDFAYDMRAGAGWIPPMGRRACLFLLLREPCAFVKVLRMLGLLKYEAAKRVALIFASHPLVSCDAEACSLEEQVIMVESCSPGRKYGLVIKERLQQHLSRIKVQPPHLVQADRVELIQAWARLALEVLEELIQRELVLMFPILARHGTKKDTILFIHTLDKDKRKASQMVRRHLGGLPSAKVHHPSNRRWLATLPPHTATQWMSGLTITQVVPKLGTVTISLEHDPLEILRMGDYGRSCLGAGGCYQSSAVTNAMEANKQVAYARDEAGRVIGRQLLAISEEKRLVCFQVYPLDVPEALDAFFAGYDRAFAQALQLPVEAGKEYTLAAPLELEWYDDGAWNVPPTEGIER